jgi:hypothetical protein
MSGGDPAVAGDVDFDVIEEASLVRHPLGIFSQDPLATSRRSSKSV